MKLFFISILLFVFASVAFSQTASCSWHVVGDSLEPQWLINVSAPSQNVTRFLRQDNCCSATCYSTVWLNGDFVITGTNPSNPALLFILPVGYRPFLPVNELLVFSSQVALDWHAWIEVRTNGEVWLSRPANIFVGDRIKFTISFLSQ